MIYQDMRAVMMSAMRGVIWLISGTPGAGKTTVARALCARYPRALHIPVDDLRDFVVSGFASPLEQWTEETTQQFALARATASRMAAMYADAGFAVVIDDVVREADMPQFTTDLGGQPVHKVLLDPRVEVALERNRLRTNKSFDTAALAPSTVHLHAVLRAGCRPEDGWVVVDNSDRDSETVASELLRHA